MSKISITIGIPAYNEEANIGLVLGDVLNQKLNDGYIDQIIVVSDGSRDRTVEEVKKIKNKKLVVIVNKKRQGLANVQNIIIENTDSDILVILNADIRLSDVYTLEKIISPIARGKADLVTPSVIEAGPDTFFEKILYVSTKIKNMTYEKYNNGKNVYTCRGLARAFSKRLYKEIMFTSSIGEDGFSYFYCVVNNFKYSFSQDAKVIFRLPNTFQDHKKQSIRFFKSQGLLKEKFGKDFISKSYKLPKLVLVKSLVENFIEYPSYTSLYLGVLFYLKLRSLFYKNDQDKWDISKSSKKVKVAR